MTAKQIVQELLNKLPDGISLHDIAQEIVFIAAAQQELAETARGKCIPIEEVESELPSWIAPVTDLDEDALPLAESRDKELDSGAVPPLAHADLMKRLRG